MAWRKICPTCGFENPPDLLMCDRCLGDISGTPPGERAEGPEAAPPAAPSPAGTAAPPAAVTLVFPDGRRLALSPGDEVGREAKGAELFAGVETVSRRHVRLALRDGRPALVDLGSTNGTWLRGVRLVPDTPALLEDGAALSLSSRVVCRVEIGGRDS